MNGTPITILYKRLPDRISRIPGILLYALPEFIVIKSEISVSTPLVIEETIVMDKGYIAVWFVFRSSWFDVGKIYDTDGHFTGYYCDIIEPISEIISSPKETTLITDLFLDLWIQPDGSYIVLDEDEFDRALEEGLLTAEMAKKALSELMKLIELVKSGQFPPEIVSKFQISD